MDSTKGIQIWKEEVKIFFADDILYTENPKDTTKYSVRTNKQIQENSTWKSGAFLYTNNEPSEKETKKQFHLTMASRRVKYLELT